MHAVEGSRAFLQLLSADAPLTAALQRILLCAGPLPLPAVSYTSVLLAACVHRHPCRTSAKDLTFSGEWNRAEQSLG
jgi:hypothetical protein